MSMSIKKSHCFQLFDSDGLNQHVFRRDIAMHTGGTGADFGNFIHDIHALYNLAEYRIAPLLSGSRAEIEEVIVL